MLLVRNYRCERVISTLLIFTIINVEFDICIHILLERYCRRINVGFGTYIHVLLVRYCRF